MSEELLTSQQQAAAQLLAIGGIEKQVIAERVGTSRTTLYNWINKNEKFIAEVHRLKHEFKIFGNELMQSKLVDAVNGYWDLIKKTNNDMVAAKGYEFYIERALGKVSSKMEITANTNDTNQVNVDILEAEHEKWLKELDEEK